MGCVALFGPVEDRNGDLDRVSVAIDGDAVEGVMLNPTLDARAACLHAAAGSSRWPRHGASLR